MTAQHENVEQRARDYARTAGAALKDEAAFYRSLPDDAWDGPTGCAGWTMHDLAGHAVGEAVWDDNLVRQVTEKAQPLPDTLWDELKALPGSDIADAIEAAADDLVEAVESASTEDLQHPADMGFTTMPLWQAVYVALSEAVFHNWDAHVGRDPNATIPTPWARELATRGVEFGSMLARRRAAKAAGRYLLEVGDGVGPVSVIATDGDVTVQRGRIENPDVLLHLTADQYVRLLAGRLPLPEAIDSGKVAVEGDRARAVELNRIFPGIAVD